MGTRAEADYWAAEDAVKAAHAGLAATVDPQRRACLLRDLANHTVQMAGAHYAAFGPDRVNGIDMSVSLGHEAHLYGLLRHVEYAVAISRSRFVDGSALDRAGAMVLDEMAATADLVDRMRLLESLYDVMVPLVDGQAAEGLATLPAPGMRGWRTP